MRAVVVVSRFGRHGARRKRKVQPDSSKQREGAADPGPLLAIDAASWFQVLVSSRILALSPISSVEIIGTAPVSYTHLTLPTILRV